MGLFHIHTAGAKFSIAAIIVGVLHMFEDLGLVLAGRYTEVNLLIVLLAGVLFSACIAGSFRLKLVKKYLL